MGNAEYMGTISFNISKQAAMKLLLLTLGSILSLGFAQDTYHCPDGWMLEEDRSGCRCFYFSESEMVTREDADYLCQSHNDAWVAELDHPGINYWLKSRLLDMTDIDNMNSFGLEPSQRDVTVRATQENGFGLTRMKQSHGLIGLMVNLTTFKEKIVWF